MLASDRGLNGRARMEFAVVFSSRRPVDRRMRLALGRGRHPTIVRCERGRPGRADTRAGRRRRGTSMRLPAMPRSGSSLRPSTTRRHPGWGGNRVARPGGRIGPARHRAAPHEIAHLAKRDAREPLNDAFDELSRANTTVELDRHGVAVAARATRDRREPRYLAQSDRRRRACRSIA